MSEQAAAVVIIFQAIDKMSMEFHSLDSNKMKSCRAFILMLRIHNNHPWQRTRWKRIV